jgi:hypothetical protein
MKKKYILTSLILLVLNTQNLFAQLVNCNPYVQNMQFLIPPASTGFPCGSAQTVQFTMGLSLPNNATNWENAPIGIVICLNRFTFNGSIANTVSGSFASKFDWTYDAFAPSCLFGTQNQTINGLSSGTILLNLNVPANAATNAPLAVNANLQVPGYLSSGNIQADDNALVITKVFCGSNLNLKLLLQGYYTGSNTMTPTLLNEGVGSSTLNTDTIKVELRNSTTPYSLVTSAKTILKTNGTATVTFNPAPPNGNYFITIKHRNSIESWSASPIAIPTSVIYNFTSAANKAYGDNQIEIESGVWAFFSGDMDQDGQLDNNDFSIWEIDAANFAGGYIVSDLNGDGVVDNTDFGIWENNSASFVSKLTP